MTVRVFSFVPQRKQRENSRLQNRKQQKNASRALSFSRSATAPSRREPLFVHVFSLYRRENKDKIHGSKLKVRTFFFCGNAAFHHEPSSGRKVSRVSVTEGASGTEKQRKTASRALSFSRSATAPSRREPLFVCFFLCTAEKTNAEFEFSKLKVCTFFFCGSAAFHHEPFWEEGGTRQRDGRSKRD